MQFKVKAQLREFHGQGEIGGKTFSVVLGRNGVIESARKCEGDGCTPLGTYTVLYGMYRPDRVANPAEGAGQHLKWLPLTPQMGWCDAPEDALYNCIVPVGYGASHELMWREDSAYDRVLVISHNLPAVPHLGSAVFIHQLHPGKMATAGCVALAPVDMEIILNENIDKIEITLI